MNLRREVSKALVARGFERDGRSHRLRLSDGFSFYVDTGPLGRQSDISPEIGIRHDEVERIACELEGLEYDEWVGTVGANVGYVNGDGYRTWEGIESKEEVLRELDKAMDRLRPYLRLDRLLDAWPAIRMQDDPVRTPRQLAIMLLTGVDRAIILQRLDHERPLWFKLGNDFVELFQRIEAGVHRHLAARANK